MRGEALRPSTGPSKDGSLSVWEDSRCGPRSTAMRAEDAEEASASSPTFEIRNDRHSGNSESEFVVPPPLIDELGMEGVPSMIGNTVS